MLWIKRLSAIVLLVVVDGGYYFWTEKADRERWEEIDRYEAENRRIG